ncbi:TetR family transcriptional regulator [Streptomyces sp. FH025]|uniref:TetR family transcriptional regulator n=1 Tax=Streptomyces sp. FH025 TaxID=2815937 RepID=UPI001A9D6651|nr:TetR family transcriptional regulator [Streptomyces sp. FH025]MBO1413850.1 TetR family transcriptional regulator [Streptomyces sp. FH025]
MAWDTAKTKRLLLDAAVDEFAAHGPEGARIDRIAAAAGVNKERIYPYFGGKRQLFEAVVERELERLAGAVPLEGVELPEYAGRVFDYHLAHPHLLRLLQWEALSGEAGGPVAGEERRSAYYAEKVAAVARARTAASDPALPPGELLYAVVALAGWQFAVPQLARMILGGAAESGAAESGTTDSGAAGSRTATEDPAGGDPAARREAVVELVRRLVR